MSEILAEAQTDIVTNIVTSLPPVPAGLLAEAAAAGDDLAEHDRLAARVEALHSVEYRPLQTPETFHLPQRIVAWNAERVKHPAAAAELLRATGAGVILLSEVDCGMARTGNRHNAADLAARLGMGYLYGVEFVELGLGAGAEEAASRGEHNTRSLHGNALLSRAPLADIRLIRLDEGGFWFGGRRGQKRLGGRMALAARLGSGADALLAISVHLESDSDPTDRAAQMRSLLAGLEPYGPDLPAVIGGDLNTNALPDNPKPDGAWFSRPESFEPLFSALRAAGFTYTAANLPQPTQRVGTTGRATDNRRLDWFFTRNLAVSAPATLPALAPGGTVLSDHEALAISVGRTS